MHKLLYEDVTHAILGGFYDVYNQLGRGFLEPVYESAMEIQRREAGLLVKRQCEAPVYFRGHLVGKFVIDLLVENKIIVELKACRTIALIHEAQVIPSQGDSLRSWPSPQFWPKTRVQEVGIFQRKQAFGYRPILNPPSWCRDESLLMVLPRMSLTFADASRSDP